MKKLLSKYKLELGGGLVGTTAGWCYWMFVGCASGSCLITSSPINSTIYGAILGSLVFGLLRKRANESESTKSK